MGGALGPTDLRAVRWSGHDRCFGLAAALIEGSSQSPAASSRRRHTTPGQTGNWKPGTGHHERSELCLRHAVLVIGAGRG
jgi:hypothetical protein